MALTDQDVYRFGAAAKKQIMEKMAAAGKPAAKPSKMHNVKDEYGGIVFQSKKEAARYKYLIMLQNAGVISDLRLQHNITITEGFTKPNGERVRPLVYVADFSYIKTMDKKQERVYEDAKGMRTRTYINKKKLVYELKGIEIKEV